MSEKYLSSFADQESALSYTVGGETLISPQVSLIEGVTELVYSKEIPHGSKIRFEKDEETGKLYFVVDGVYYSMKELLFGSVPTGITYIPVDLGIKDASGKTIYFADRNVGAYSPSDYGTYFSWGNVEGATIVGQKQMSEDDLIEQLIIISLGGEATPEQIEEAKNNPEIMNEINAAIPTVTGLISGYLFDLDTYATTLGGQYTGSELDAEHDAATANMGDEWRMPTSAETMALVEGTDQYAIRKDENGEIVVEASSAMSETYTYISMCFVKKGDQLNYGVSNNYIELPFAGACTGGLLVTEGLFGCVWSSSLNEGDSSFARYLAIYNFGNVHGNNSHIRFVGQPVRGVRVGEVG